MIGMAIGICIYYCSVEESIPLSLLLRYIFSGDHVDGHGLHGRANSSNNPNFTSSQGQVDRELSESKLIVRRLLQVEITSYSVPLPVKNDDDNYSFNDNRIQFSTERELENNADDGDRIDPRQHPFPIEIFTENKSLHFSEPLVMKVEEEDNDDKNAEKSISAKKEREIANNNNEIGDDSNHDHNTSNNDDNDRLERRRRSQNDSDLQNVVIALDDIIESIENTLPENHVCCRTVISEDGGARTSDNVVPDGCLYLFQECNDNGSKNDDCDDKDDHQKHHKNDSNETIQEADYNCFDIEGDIRDRGTTCDICILEFEVGDEVAWSPNLDCIHTFHKDCILDWLMRNPTCPNCRLDYLKRKSDEDI